MVNASYDIGIGHMTDGHIDAVWIRSGHVTTERGKKGRDTAHMVRLDGVSVFSPQQNIRVALRPNT